MARVIGLVVALVPAALMAAPAAARPPFPYEVFARAGCERSEIGTRDHDLVATTCMVGVDLLRSGPASLVLELAGSDASDHGPLADLDVVTWAGVLGLDLNFGRTHGDLGVEVLFRMMVLSARTVNDTVTRPYPFAYGAVRVGVGWRWVELGGTPWPRPGDLRMLHLGYGMDLFHWTMVFGVGLFGAPTVDPTGALEVVGPAFGAYGEVLGRLGDFRVGLRAVLGGAQSLMLVLGWQWSLL